MILNLSSVLHCFALLLCTAVALECFVGDNDLHKKKLTKCPGSWQNMCYAAKCPDTGFEEFFCTATNATSRLEAQFLATCPEGVVRFCKTDRCNE